MTRKIRKILIANRGEIAVRVIRTCREMGIGAVAVFSEADRGALFVRLADEALPIGPAPASESYLRADGIIAAALKSRADAVHPGYGFLSENADFSRAIREAGLIFIGPGPEAIEAMGDKIAARQLALKAGVPVIPGTIEPVGEIAELERIASSFGYPVLLKAKAGGGGKGMRVVRAKNELPSAFAMASGEALKAFGDGELYVEKLLEHPRHVEIQIARDALGNGAFLMERECSLQRRHQKVVEEAPCDDLKDEVRQKMAAAALSLAEASDYLGVGTVECLMDERQDFYFLEMNTRLQVEHPLTEAITGLDLVALQIRIAQGEKLGFGPEPPDPRGHAIECRVYAEDPENGFLPSPGRITSFIPPEGPGVRVDTGVGPGADIPVHYDPLIAKLIVHAEDRVRAIAKMSRALSDFVIIGPRHNLRFLRTLVDHGDFRSGKMHTQYIEAHPELARAGVAETPPDAVLAAAAWDALQGNGGGRGRNGGPKKAIEDNAAPSLSPWWRSGLERAMRGPFARYPRVDFPGSIP